MSPRSFFSNWSAVSLTGSSSGHVIALDQSEARKSAIRAHLTTREGPTLEMARKNCGLNLFYAMFEQVTHRICQTVPMWLL